MTDFLKQDIFFFITTVAVVVIMLLAGVLLIYLIKIVRSVNYILDKVRLETDIITRELGELRASIRSEGIKIKQFAKFFGNLRKK